MPILDPNKHSENRFRRNRFRLFKSMIEPIIMAKGRCRILDVGGEPNYWLANGTDLDWRKVTVVLLNLFPFEIKQPGLTSVAGDARDMKEYDSLSFDIVHSNSVIEHVGRWDDMVAMANEVRRLGPHYFVQTPYFWFPIEPHARFLAYHWMPESWRYRILMKRSLGFWQKRPDVGSAVNAVQSAVLLDRKQMQFLFSDAKIISERFLGFTKSLIAIR
jgi:hypothetical protein